MVYGDVGDGISASTQLTVLPGWQVLWDVVWGCCATVSCLPHVRTEKSTLWL